MTRIISGQWGGRRLEAPKGSGTRPTTDRVREAVFSSLQSHFGSLAGLRVLDLFAGTGALGLEAISRGAQFTDFVEQDPKASATLQSNIQKLSANHQTQVHHSNAARFVRNRTAHNPVWDIVFLDPPYDMPSEELTEILVALDAFVDRAGVFVVERAKRSTFQWPKDFEPLREKRYGESRIWYGR